MAALLGWEREEACFTWDCTCAPLRTGLISREGEEAGTAWGVHVRAGARGAARLEGCAPLGTARARRCSALFGGEREEACSTRDCT